ncbi:MAG: fimbrial assembly protein FimA, partial [Anaerolineae bacterium]|nr:fimbrial assembly protein FimA [Anaerolineae bacterium]
KLGKLVEMHHLFFGEVDPADLVPLAEVAAELQEMLTRTGHYDGQVSGVFDEATRKSLIALAGTENLEERWTGTEDEIDGKALDYLREKFG